MKTQIQRRIVSMHTILVCGGLLSISILGLTNWALASDPRGRLHIESGRLTGELTQMTLRAVLDRLHDQLGINYVVPAGELGKVVSVTLQKEPLTKALSKILAPWDYAFTLDSVGNIKTIYVMTKVSPEASLADTGMKGKGPASRENPGSDMRHEEQVNIIPMPGLPRRQRTAGSGKEITYKAVPMEIRPPAPGTSMPILPANPKGMQVTPGTRAHAMKIIPSTAYPPMNIQPVPEHVQQELLLTLRP
jgi:hypothetical protein